MTDKPTKYTIASFRYGDLIDDEIDSTDNLERAIELARDQDTYGGKYTHCVFDGENVVADIRDPSEGTRIDVMQHDWLDEIQDDYGIDDAQFRKAIDYWLEQHKVNE